MRIGFEAKKGSTGILLLHGLTGTPEEMRPLGDYLSKRKISTLCPWLAGHGATPKELAKTRWQDWAESAREAFEVMRKKCSAVFVAGLSMGGDQALHLASHFPVAGVISLSTPVKITDFRFNAIGLLRFLQWRTSGLTGGVLDPKAPAHQTYPYLATKNLLELKRLMDHVREDLPYVTAPALVVQGKKDSMVAPLNGGLIYQGLGSQVKHLLYLENSDHVVTLDYDHEVLFEKVFNFIRSKGRSLN
jgi:carboxylesterase